MLPTARQYTLVMLFVLYSFGCVAQDIPDSSIGSHQLTYEFPQRYSSLKAIDFKYLPFIQVFDEGGHPKTSLLKLRNGKYARRYRVGGEEISLEELHYLPSDRAVEFALGLYLWQATGGSSSVEGIARVFTLDQGHLRIVQEIIWDNQTGEDTARSRFDPITKTLVIRSAHYLENDAHCCVSATEVAVFKWSGAQFEKSESHVELTKYGRQQSKTLP
jgi:hypothetical protein